MYVRLAELQPLLASLAGLLQDLEASSGASAYLSLIVILVLGACLVPIPEEAAFAIGGTLAARGSLSLPMLFVLGWSTVLVLDLALYALGRRAGPDLARSRVGRRVGEARWARLRELAERRGAWGVVGARFVMGTRIPTFVLAGALGMPRGRFLAAVGVAGLFSAGIPLLLGYAFGAHLEDLLAALGTVRWLLLGIVLVALLVWWQRGVRS